MLIVLCWFIFALSWHVSIVMHLFSEVSTSITWFSGRHDQYLAQLESPQGKNFWVCTCHVYIHIMGLYIAWSCVLRSLFDIENDINLDFIVFLPVYHSVRPWRRLWRPAMSRHRSPIARAFTAWRKYTACSHSPAATGLWLLFPLPLWHVQTMATQVMAVYLTAAWRCKMSVIKECRGVCRCSCLSRCCWHLPAAMCWCCKAAEYSCS